MKKKVEISVSLAILTLVLSSCATMFNSKEIALSIITSECSRLIFNGDTSVDYRTESAIKVNRSSEPLIVTAYNETHSKTVKVKPRNSFAYWLNLYPNWHLWTGFLIDTKTKRRYSYPRTVFLDFSKADSTYFEYKPLDKPYDKYSSILKFTPFKLVGVTNPSIELSYEKGTGPILSTQIMASYLLPFGITQIGNTIDPQIEGYRVSIEEKFYFKKSAPNGYYFAFELDLLKNKYKDIWNFGIKHIYYDSTYKNTNYPDTFGINKKTISLNLKFGYQLIMKRFSFDFYCGLGCRYKSVSHFDRINPNDEMEGTRHPNVSIITNSPGKYWTISLPLNMRVGWTF